MERPDRARRQFAQRPNGAFRHGYGADRAWTIQKKIARSAENGWGLVLALTRSLWRGITNRGARTHGRCAGHCDRSRTVRSLVTEFGQAELGQADLAALDLGRAIRHRFHAGSWRRAYRRYTDL